MTPPISLSALLEAEAKATQHGGSATGHGPSEVVYYMTVAFEAARQLAEALQEAIAALEEIRSVGRERVSPPGGDM